MFHEIRQLKTGAGLLALTLLAATYSLVDQAFTALLSSTHTYALSIASCLAVAVAVVARVTGQTILVSRGGEDFRRPAMLVFAALLAPTLGGGGVLAALAPMLRLDGVPGFAAFALLSGAAAWLLGFNLLQKYQFVGTGRLGPAIVADIAGNLLNAGGNLLAMRLGADAGERFVGLAAATLLSQLVVAAILAAMARPLALTPFRDYVRVMRDVLRGEAVVGLLHALLPTAIVFAAARLYGDGIGAAVGVGFAAGFFLDRPFTANLMATIRLTSSAADATEREAIASASRRVTGLWVLLVLATAPLLPLLLNRIYGVDDGPGTIVALAVIAGCLIRAAANPAVAAIKAARAHRTLSRIEWVAGDALALGAVALGAAIFGSDLTSASLGALAAGLALPSVAWAVLVRRNCSNL